MSQPAPFTTSYRQVIAYKGALNWRGRLRHLVLHIISFWWLVTGKADAALATPRIHFVYLHYLFDDEVESLKQLLSRLARTHDFVSYSQAVEMLQQGHTPQKPAICFSSDDGFKNNLRLADVLEEFGVTCCFFVCADMLDQPTYAQKAAFCADRLNYPPRDFLNVDELKQLQARGHEIGCHTAGHLNLATLNKNQLEQQINQAKERLETHFGPLLHFAWPYGLKQHYSALAHAQVCISGFETSCSAMRGAHAPTQPTPGQDLCIHRDQLVAWWPLQHILYFLAKSAHHSHNKKFSFSNYST